MTQTSRKDANLRDDLVAKIAATHDLTKAKAHAIVASVFDGVYETMETNIGNPGFTANVFGFGVFKIKAIPEGPKRNPKTGETFMVPAHNAVGLKLAKRFKDLGKA